MKALSTSQEGRTVTMVHAGLGSAVGEALGAAEDDGKSQQKDSVAFHASHFQ